MTDSRKRLKGAELGKIARGVLETASCVVVFLDLEGNVTHLNGFGERFLGGSEEEVAGKSWVEEFVPPEERHRVREVFQAIARGESAGPSESGVLCKGGRRPLAWVDTPIRDDSGKVAGIARIGIGFPQEERLRSALQERETRIRVVMDNMVDGFVTVDERGIIETFNRAAERMFGYPPEEVIGQNFSLLMAEPHQEGRDDSIRSYLRTGEAEVLGVGREVAGRRKDGSTFPLALALAEIRLDERRMYAGSLRDLTRERALRSAAQSEHRLKAAIVETSVDAILALDREGRILSWNSGAEAAFGYPAAEVLGRHFRVLVPPDLLEEGEVERLERMVREEGQVRNYATRRRRKDGQEIQVVLSRTPLQNEAGELIGYSSILRDVTEENWLREQLQQSAKFSAIGELAAGLAHEIGGPLSVISGNAEFLLRSLDPGDPRREDVQGIAKECEAVASLLRRLLDFSRPARLEARPVDVNETLRNVLLLVRKLITKVHIELKLDLQVGLPAVLADPNQLEQVVMNLILNARHAMPEGGQLQIRSFATQDVGRKRRRKVGIEISDTGVGIPEENLGRVFDPFFTTRLPGEGTGLGLAISRRIVTDHQGTISVKSRVGRGTTFAIELPAMEEGTDR